MVYARIVGTGSYLPEKILSNTDLEKLVDTNDQWIIERTGIKRRHIIAENERVSDMAELAAARAITAAAIDANKIDLILVASATSEFIFPNIASILQHRLGVKNCPAIDINAACSGFIYALNIADQYIKNGSVKNILIVSCEALSRITDWQDRSTCVLFADGAGAVVLKADNVPGVHSTHIHADGSYQELLYAPSGLYGEDDHYIKMRGNEVFKVAVKKLGDVVEEALQYNNLTVDDIDWFIPHQANLRIINATIKRIKLPQEKAILTVADHGNTSAASVPLALDSAVRDGRIKRGDTILMEAFGAGFTWGAALVDY